MMYLAYLGIGIATALLVIFVPMMLGYSIDFLFAWIEGKRRGKHIPRLSPGEDWLGGLIAIVALGILSGVGWVIAKFILHIV